MHLPNINNIMISPSILIFSNPNDMHFQAVDWALKQVNIDVELVFGHCFPTLEQHSALIDNSAFNYHCVDAMGREIDITSANTVWYRRSARPKVSSEMTVEDRKLAQDEADLFIRGMRSIGSQKQRWINPPDNVAVAGRKPFQLYMAKQVGLMIPRTLMSNNPSAVRSFIEEADGGVVLKPFNAMVWEGDEQVATLYAQKIDVEDIEDWDAIKLTSHIFQRYVDKQFELRIIYLDGQILSCKLDSQRDERSRTDWRLLNTKELRPELYELPDTVAGALRRYMDALGLAYGAIDMIVDPEGNHVFLECNPTGQFLFLEDWNSDLQILGNFLYFLTKNLNLSCAQSDKLRAMRLKEFFDSGASQGYYADLAVQYFL